MLRHSLLAKLVIAPVLYLFSTIIIKSLFLLPSLLIQILDYKLRKSISIRASTSVLIGARNLIGILPVINIINTVAPDLLLKRLQIVYYPLIYYL